MNSALLVYLGTTLWGFGILAFALVNLVLVAGWIAVALGVLRENDRLHADVMSAQPPGEPALGTEG